MARKSSNRERIGARRCAVQAIYQWIISSTKPQTIVDEFLDERELRKVDLEYFTELALNIPRRHDALLAALSPLLDRAWPQIDPVERAVLLLGAYELCYCPHIPWRVVVNEGVELCKMFGAQDAHRYINGVLEKLAQSSREVEIAG